MPYPKPASPLFATIFYSVFAALGVAFVALAFKAWEMGIYGPAVFLSILGGFVAPVFMRYVVRHVAAWVRGARGAWWLRLSTTGFEVNERLFGPPRRYKWCEIDSFILTGESRSGRAGRLSLFARMPPFPPPPWREAGRLRHGPLGSGP